MERNKQGRRGRRRLIVGVTALAMLAPMTAVAEQPYDDVDPESPHSEAISELSEREVMVGRSENRFAPAATVTRAQLASIVARAAGLEPSEERPFEDVDDGPHADNIAAAHEAGLVRGYEDGTFRPSQSIARDQIASVLFRWLEPPEADGAQFSDLDDSVHATAINALAEADIARGTGDGRFRPRADLRRDQAASFVWRAISWLERERTGWNGEEVLDLEMPEGDISGVDYHGTIPLEGVSSINVVDYDEGTVMVAFGTAMGMRTYDITDPMNPTQLDHLDVAELALEGDDPDGTFWSAESLNIDKDRDVAFLSRDPRSFQQPQDSGVAGFYVIDLADPTDIQLRQFHEVPAGHTATCVNGCDYLWSGGPAPAADQPDEWIGRPIFVTDVRNLDDIQTFEDPVDTGRYRGQTDYAHDVQVDQQGVAWVSGRGGLRGYWTEGTHEDPTTGETREATATDPVPFAGGEVGEYHEPDDESRMWGAIHNSERPVDGPDGDYELEDSERPRRPAADDGADLDDYAPGELVYVTDENFSQPCSDAGKFYINSIDGATDGQGWYDEGHEPEDGGFALEQVGVWSVADKEGAADGDEDITCSAHYFQMRGGIVAGAWYTQGFRFLDVTDPTDPIQTAYFRPDEGNGFAPMWHGDVVYAGDSALGIHLLTLGEDAAAASAEREEVLAPERTATQVAAARATTAALEPDDVYGWSCALPTIPPADA
jgi:hypothetical protein